MNHTLTLLTALLLAPLDAPAQQTPTVPTAGLVGDGTHDDTAAIQALLDSRRTLVYLPAPLNHYRISQPLRIHSNQTLQLDCCTMIRLKDGSDCLMITNDDHERGNENITLIGGVWDMHNEGQSLAEYQKTRNWKGAYEPARDLGVLPAQPRDRLEVGRFDRGEEHFLLVREVAEHRAVPVVEEGAGELVLAPPHDAGDEGEPPDDHVRVAAHPGHDYRSNG